MDYLTMTAHLRPRLHGDLARGASRGAVWAVYLIFFSYIYFMKFFRVKVQQLPRTGPENVAGHNQPVLTGTQ